MSVWCKSQRLKPPTGLVQHPRPSGPSYENKGSINKLSSWNALFKCFNEKNLISFEMAVIHFHLIFLTTGHRPFACFLSCSKSLSYKNPVQFFLALAIYSNAAKNHLFVLFFSSTIPPTQKKSCFPSIHFPSIGLRHAYVLKYFKLHHTHSTCISTFVRQCRSLSGDRKTNFEEGDGKSSIRQSYPIILIFFKIKN